MTLFVSADFDGDDSRPTHRAILRDTILSREPRSLRIDHVSNIEGLFDLALEYALLPRLCSRLDISHSNEVLAGLVKPLLEEHALRAAARSAEAHILSNLLERESVRHVYLKGAGLAAHGVQVSTGDRHTDDIDVVVGVEDRETVLSVLADLGYVADLDSALPAVGGGTLSEQDFTTSAHAEMGLISPRGVRLDLHWFVPDAGVSDLEALLEHAVLAGPQGAQIPVPSPPLLLAQICDHVVMHHRARPAYLPRHLADVVDLIASFGPGLWAQAAPLGSRRALRFTKWLYDGVSNGSVSTRLLAPPAGVRTVWDAAAEVFDVAERVRRDVRDDPKRIVRKIVPAREFVAASYGLSEDDPRLPLCYVHRLVTLRFLFHPLRG